MNHFLKILDVRLHLSSDQEQLVEPFLGVFSAFAVAQEGPAGFGDDAVLTVRVNGEAGLYDDGRRQIRLAPAPLRQAHVYNLLYTSVVRALRGFYLLHGAVVARGGRAWVISGPSGSGKTTLGRQLARRGFDLLSDDLAPLAVADGRLHPFPRRLGLERGAGEATGDFVRLGDKDFVAAADLGHAQPAGPLPVAGVIIMNPYVDQGDAVVRLHIGVLPDDAGLQQRLAACPDVSVRGEPGPGGALTLHVEATGGTAVAAVMAAVDSADTGVLFHGRDDGGTKRWAAEPGLQPIPLRQAAVALLRETLNREPSSALMERHKGSAVAALLELIGLLEGVSCRHLTAAGIEATASFLERQLR